ncbi:hypothetical protein SDC9_179481 [bioreactor metagenome]|uniref:Uncharacterized protein n=1 Tax=bioreactor metagenome TaxID=1076179 RepID=A0A645H0K9_9ZZZZ
MVDDLKRQASRQGRGFLKRSPDHNDAMIGKFNRVADQVQENLPETVAVELEHGQIRRQVDLQPEPLLQKKRMKQGGEFVNEFGEIGRTHMELHVAGMKFGAVQKIVDHGKQRAGGKVDIAEELPPFRVRQTVGLQQFDESDDAVERCFELMAERGVKQDLRLMFPVQPSFLPEHPDQAPQRRQRPRCGE